MQRDYRLGDEVLLIVDPASVAYVEGLKKYNERRFKISKIVYAGDRPGATMHRGVIYFELDRCVSELGVPYGILKEWVYPMGPRY